MKKAIQAIGWIFFGIDAVAILFFLNWALTASSREGETAYAMFFLLFALVLLGIGGGALVFCAKRRSALGLWSGLIQSVSQAPWPGLPAWGEVGGIASSQCLKPLLPQPIST